MRRRTIITVGSGDAEVKIYTLHRKDGYSSFQAVWYELRQRKSKTFAKMEAAKLWAQQVSSSCRHELPDTHHHGQHAIASSVEARSADGKIVRVGFSNSYRGTSDEPAITRLAGEHAARYFKQSFELKIKGDVIPDAAVEPLLAELQELFARHGASAALSAKATIKPTKEFHAARHTLFSVEQNHELDKVVPISASVKTKLGRGGSDDE